jgi:hypothetical protein
MRVDVLGDPCACHCILDDLIHAATRERVVHAGLPAPLGEEDPIRRSVLRPSFNVTLQPPKRLRRERYVPASAPLSHDPEIRLPAGPVNVVRGQLRQLVEPQATVTEDPDDQFVAFTVDRLLKLVDLLPGEDVAERSRAHRELRFSAHLLPLLGCPRQHLPDRADIAVDGVLRDDVTIPLPAEQRRCEAINRPAIEVPDGIDVLAGAPREDDVPERIAVIVGECPGSEAARLAVSQVVVDKMPKR